RGFSLQLYHRLHEQRRENLIGCTADIAIVLGRLDQQPGRVPPCVALLIARRQGQHERPRVGERLEDDPVIPKCERSGQASRPTGGEPERVRRRHWRDQRRSLTAKAAAARHGGKKILLASAYFLTLI